MAPEQDAIRRNIERTVDKTALRKVRNLVDNFESEERARKNKQTRVMAVTAIGFTLLIILVVLFAFKPISYDDQRARMKERTKACQNRSILSQQAAMEKELRAANPGITVEEVRRKFDEFAVTFDTRASNACAGTK